MSKWLYNILFVMITIFFVFIGIENVDAKDYSYINCTYTWKADVINENTKTFSLKVNYNTKGKLVMDDSVDYSNGVTRFGNKISNGISNVMTKGLSGLFDALKGLFW